MQALILGHHRLYIFADAEALARGLADRFVDLSADASRRRGRFTVALAGGHTPRALYSLLAQPAYSERIDWGGVHLFWGDERCVAKDHPDSNYKMVNEALLSAVPIAATNVHAPVHQDEDPEQAAVEYEHFLKRFFALSDRQLPQFDLVLLGVGSDGHTASLFPGTPAIDERDRLVTSVYVAKLQSYRLTLTLPVINNASNVIFMVDGADKREILAAVLGTGGVYPAQLVRPVGGGPDWYVDKAAAAGLRAVWTGTAPYP